MAVDSKNSKALRRRSTFPNRSTAFAHFERGPLGKFDPRALDGYLDKGLVASVDGVSLQLACEPTYEAAIYEQMPADLLDKLQLSLKCPVTFVAGSDSSMFSPHFWGYGSAGDFYSAVAGSISGAKFAIMPVVYSTLVLLFSLPDF